MSGYTDARYFVPGSDNCGAIMEDRGDEAARRRDVLGSGRGAGAGLQVDQGGVLKMVFAQRDTTLTEFGCVCLACAKPNPWVPFPPCWPVWRQGGRP
jgi:hypothetical protein